MHWEAYATKSWKIGTLKGLFRRAFYICSTEEARKKEIQHLKYVFTKINGYPNKIVHKILNEVKKEGKKENVPEEQESSDEETKVIKPYICLPFRGREGEKLLSKFKGDISKVLPKEIQPRFIYKGTKIGSYFSVKDKVKTEHQTNLCYGYTPPGKTLKDGYIGETKVRFGKRVKEHVVEDKTSAVYKYSQEENIQIDRDDFTILERGYPKYIDRVIAESLFVKDHNPILNGQKNSYKLKLFN